MSGKVMFLFPTGYDVFLLGHEFVLNTPISKEDA